MMKPDSPTFAALCEALENHIRETEPEEVVLTAALVVWEGAGVDGWQMNYLVLPHPCSPATSYGLAHYAIEELKPVYRGPMLPADEEPEDDADDAA
jgi:hypothetical protein